MEFRKTHSAPKRMVVGEAARQEAAEAMRLISELVGGTLGPGGKPVLIERADDLPPALTKDGVTVFKSIGFLSPVKQAVMEAYRDAAVRTANEAGDGTTTATILAEAIGRYTREYCDANPGYSPHRVVRELEVALKDVVEPAIKKMAIRTSLEKAAGRKVLRQVATISANGDEELADSVMRCYDFCGDEGNVTLVEASGESRYEEEEIQGYPIPTGYEEGAGPYAQGFIREPNAQRTFMKRPLWILYFGKVEQFSVVEGAFEALVGQLKRDKVTWGQEDGERNIIFVAPWFSESVIGNLKTNFSHVEREPNGDGTFTVVRPPRIIPLRALRTIQGSERAFLDDLAAVTGATVYEPNQNPLEKVTFEGMGGILEQEPEGLTWRGRTESCEVGRLRSSIMGYADPGLIELRAEELQAALRQGGSSKLEVSYLTERLARLSGGIARLTIYGASGGETREKRDRAEDAVCAVRGALRSGALYGGCWALLQAADLAVGIVGPLAEVLWPALREPFRRLLDNVGITDDVDEKADEIVDAGHDAPVIFDALNLKMVDPRKAGVYDSVPAVLEALRSALSIASVMGTLGGIVVQARDGELERQEAASQTAHDREVAAGHYDVNVHDEHGV